MPQSLSAVFVHVVFSTKERRPWLQDPSVRATLHQYLGGISRELDCPTVLVGGMPDHVHLLARLGRTTSLAEWVKELKRVSHLWLAKEDRVHTLFEWQGGYAAFSVSQSRLAAVEDYIARQEHHHCKLSFQDELRSLLRRHGLEFDERYVWT